MRTEVLKELKYIIVLKLALSVNHPCNQFVSCLMRWGRLLCHFISCEYPLLHNDVEV
jgi:hypothetical protein